MLKEYIMVEWITENNWNINKNKTLFINNMFCEHTVSD